MAIKYITDMSRCVPSSSLSTRSKRNHWRRVEYVSEQLSGTMLLAGAVTEAPDITCPLDVKGWHAISIGYWLPTHEQRVEIKVRLTSDPCFVVMADNEPDGMTAVTVREAFWKYEDLTGEQIILGQQTKGTSRPACVAYIKLQPLCDSQVEAIQTKRADKSTRTITVTNDGGSFMTTKAPTTAEEICEQIEPYRYSDVGRIDWAICYGDMTNYPSKVGWNYFEERYCDDYPNEGDRRIMQSLRALADQGLVLHELAMKHAREMGLEFHAMIRLGIGNYPPPFDAGGGLMADRPEMRLVARDGTPLPKISYAFPEVRRRMLDIIEEILDDEIDGINLCWMRGAPCVAFEKPVADAFRDRYGDELDGVSDDDERLWRVWADIITDFMREVRKLTNRVGQRRKRPVKVTTMVGGTTFSCALSRGHDIRQWIEEKLIDDIIAAAINSPYYHDKGIRQHLYIGPDGPDAYRAGVKMALETGAPASLIFDVNGVQELQNHWVILRELGHREQIIDGKSELPQPMRCKMTSIGGIDVTHTAPWGGVAGEALVMYTNG